MRCLECDYPLWNLSARQCPECGKPFQPGEYEFVPNSVRFCCPHCDQPYYGTGAKGHLRPPEFECVGCGTRIAMNEMVLRPTAGVSEVQTKVERMPWLERQSYGRIRAWFAMIGLGMTGPHRLAKSMPGEDPAGQAWWYGIVTWAIFLFCGAAAPFAVIALIRLLDGDMSDATEMGVASMGFMIGGTISTLVYVSIWGLVTHAMLKITGGCNGSMARTFSALLYASGPGVLLAVPCIGPYCFSWVASVWWVVSAILLVAFLQRVHGGRATAAVLVFPGVLTLLMVGGYFGWVYYIMAVGLPGTMGTMGAAAGAAEVQIMVTELRQNASQDDAPWPGHASQLVTDGGFGIDNFVLMETSTITDDIPVADTTLAGLVMQTPNRQTLATQAAADALPDDVVAHRVGDFVFTYHGLDLLGGDPGLWIVLSSPDPDAGPHPNAGGLTTVGLLDGSVVTYFDAVEFATALQDQNALRLDNGVQGLPDPSTVTHGTPAR